MANFNWAYVNVDGVTVVNSLSASTFVSASTFHGDGSGLTGVGGNAITGAFTANYNVLSTYDVMTVNTSGSVVTASLLAANSYSAGQRLVFKDIGGSGSTNNVVIKPSGSQTIDSGTSLKIEVNYGAVSIVSDGASTFHIIGVN